MGELLSFLQRLGVDGRGVEASALFDIADDVAGSHPALSGSVLERMQAGAPMPARPAHPWDRDAFAQAAPTGRNHPSLLELACMHACLCDDCHRRLRF